MKDSTTIYEAIGGQPAVMAAVDLFYRRVLADPALAGYFHGIPLQRLKGHQAAFLAWALGGPARYRGRSMAEAHAGLAITHAAFDRVAGHLAATLSELGVAQELIERIIARIAPLRADVVQSEDLPASA